EFWLDGALQSTDLTSPYSWIWDTTVSSNGPHALVGDVKGEGASGRTVRPRVPMRQRGADCSVVVMKRGNSRGAKGAGHSRHDQLGQLATGGTDWLWRRAAALNGWHEPCDWRQSRTVL